MTAVAEHVKVLLVEDNAADARLVRELLRDTGWKDFALTHADRLDRAVACLRAEGFNAILLDLNLPDSAGLETFARTFAAASGVPILVLTGLLDEELAMAAVRDGAQDYLVKGQVDGGVLRRAIQYGIERKNAATALRESEERFRLLAEHIKEAFFLSELSSRKVLYLSPTFEDLWGVRTSEVYARPELWLAGIHPDDRPAIAAGLQENEEGRGTTTVFRVVRPDGTMRWARARAFPVPGADRLVGVVEDITEFRRVEEQATQAQRMEAVGRLAGGVAHDFNNLLTVILGEVELTLMDANPSTAIAESLGEIKRAGERASALTRQLLAFSRRQVIEPVVFDVNDVVKEMAKMMGRLIGEDIELITTVAPAPAIVRADRGQVEQVLANLVVNSRDAMPQGGHLTVEVAVAELDSEYASTREGVTPGIYVMIVVSDTGTGMTPEVQARIFEPFFTTKERGKGTGLGLATSFGIAKQSGGHISVYSEVGIGTTIRVYLPQIVAAETRAAGVTAAAMPRGHEKILLVEDDAGVRRVASRILRGQGYRVVEARDAEQALTHLGATGPAFDLLLTDVVLPGLGGRQLAEQVKALKPDIRVLFASGYTDDVILQHQLLEQGITLVQKPFTRELLARKVREVLDS